MEATAATFAAGSVNLRLPQGRDIQKGCDRPRRPQPSTFIIRPNYPLTCVVTRIKNVLFRARVKGAYQD